MERNIEEISRYIGKEGKQQLKKKLEEGGLLISLREMVGEMNELFADKVNRWPVKLREVWTEMG